MTWKSRAIKMTVFLIQSEDYWRSYDDFYMCQQMVVLADRDFFGSKICDFFELFGPLNHVVFVGNSKNRNFCKIYPNTSQEVDFHKIRVKTPLFKSKKRHFGQTTKCRYRCFGDLAKVTFFTPKKWSFDPNFIKIDFLWGIGVNFAKSIIFWVSDKNYMI